MENGTTITAQHAHQQQPPSLQGEILVVDDDPGMCALVKMFLKKETKLDVTTTVDPRVALHLMQIKNFNLVITDIKMPGITGINLIKTALATALQDLPTFIVISGENIAHTCNDEDRDFLRQTTRGFLMKPFVRQQLLDIVTPLLPSASLSA